LVHEVTLVLGQNVVEFPGLSRSFGHNYGLHPIQIPYLKLAVLKVRGPEAPRYYRNRRSYNDNYYYKNRNFRLHGGGIRVMREGFSNGPKKKTCYSIRRVILLEK